MRVEPAFGGSRATALGQTDRRAVLCSTNIGSVVDSDVVRDFVARNLASWRGGALRPLGVGDFATWAVGDDFIVRFAFNEEGNQQLRREAAALPVVGSRLNVRVPQVVALAESSVGYLAVVYPLIPGTSGEDLRPEGPAWHAAADTVSDCLARLHAIDAEQVDAGLPRWEVDYAARLAEVVDLAGVVREQAPEAVTPLMRTYLRGEVPLPAPVSERALCHTDLKGEHFLLDPESEAVIAVIDWADVAVDDPAVDIGSLAIWLGEGFVRSVAERYGASPELVERGLFRIRTWILSGFAKMLAGENSWPSDLVRRQVQFAFGP